MVSFCNLPVQAKGLEVADISVMLILLDVHSGYVFEV
jgi:hypothetical protein